MVTPVWSTYDDVLVEDHAIIPRPAEQALLERVLLGDHPGTILLHGPSGTGKSTLLAWTLARASELGTTVLLLRATEAGCDVDLGGIVDLLSDVPNPLLDALPRPQARALRTTLMREAPDEAVDPRAVRVGFHGLLTALSTSPLLVAIDDAQWVDPSTLELIEHAVRRLPAGRLGLVLTTRDADVAVRLRGFTPVGSTIIEVAPALLTLAETDRLARLLGLVVSTSVVRQTHEASGGNPMWATELLRAHDLAGRGDPPASLERLVENRIAVLSADHRALLVAAALAGRPEPLLVARAAGLDDAVLADIPSAADLRPVIAVEHGLLRFAHPLFLSTVLRLAPPTHLRATHARLAALEVDDVTRARHLALSEPTDAESVAILDAAVARAVESGRRGEAARLARLAVRLTGEADPKRAGRLLRSAEAHWALGMPDQAVADLAALENTSEVHQTERVRLMRARVLSEVSAERGLAAYAELSDHEDLTLAGRAEVLAALAGLSPADEGTAARLIATAIDLDLRHDPADAPVRTVVATALADLALLRDDPEVLPLLHDAVARESRLDAAGRRAMVAMGLDATPRLSMARHLIALDDFVPARTLLDQVCAEAAPVQDDMVLASAGLERGHLEVRAGDWSRAYDEATATRDRFRLVRAPAGEVMATIQLGAIAALRGEEDTAYALLGGAADRGLSDGLPFAVATARANLGRMALAAGRIAQAVEHLAESDRAWASTALASPLFNHYLLDRAEALVAAGDIEQGMGVLTRVEQLRAPTPRLVSGALRVRATAAAEAGLLDDAVMMAETAVGALADAALPFESARAQLVLGRVLRRSRRRSDADRTLSQAQAGFASLGATTWHQQATQERARVGLRRAAGLSETEQRVADLAAEGLRNADIARALFMATKTVEAVLARVYRKLEIRGRAELARALDAQI